MNNNNQEAERAAELSAGLEAVFRTFQAERMDGVPILNHALAVEGVGFMPWNGGYIGVLITPWFMNLMLLPGTDGAFAELDPGSTVVHRFPSGDYPFIVGHEDALGFYQSCSLFSPMSPFSAQEGARATAEEVMQALFQPAEKPVQSVTAVGSILENPEQKVSRRDFLRGGFRRKAS